MKPTSGYVLDSNVFMEAARRYYSFDLVPPFWQALVHNAEIGIIRSIDRVQAEIDRGNDALSEWAAKEFRRWFESTNQPDVLQAYGQVMIWIHAQAQFMDAAKADFSQADNADAWVVAYALAKGCVVVTQEQFDPSVRRRIPIPNPCQALNVPYMDTFQMLRLLGVTLG